MNDWEKRFDRRGFIKAGIGGLAALGSAPSLLRGQIPDAGKTKPFKPIFRVLGRTGIRLPVVSMGVMNADNPDLVRAALDAGIVHLDTAHGYQRGRNEEMIGQVIKGRRRDTFVIATKVPGWPMDRETGQFTSETTGEALLEKFAISLQRLGLDHVDILYLHNVWKREAVLFEPLLKALQKAKKDGKARFIGISTHQNEAEAIRAAKESGVLDVVLTAFNFREDHREETRAAIAEAAKAGIGIVVMKPLAGGYWDKEKQLPINKQAALKWVLQDVNVHTVIPGFTTFEQLREDLAVMQNLELSEKEKADLIPPAQIAGFYCQGCRSCLSQCPQRLPIPDLMRGYMYALSYRNYGAAQDLVAELGLPADVCSACGACSVQCRQGFAVAERIRHVSSLGQMPDSFFV